MVKGSKLNKEEDYTQTLALMKTLEDETSRVNTLRLRKKIRINQNRLVYINNREEKLKKQKEYNAKRPEEIKQYRKEYYARTHK